MSIFASKSILLLLVGLGMATHALGQASRSTGETAVNLNRLELEVYKNWLESASVSDPKETTLILEFTAGLNFSDDLRLRSLRHLTRLTPSTLQSYIRRNRVQSPLAEIPTSKRLKRLDLDNFLRRKGPGADTAVAVESPLSEFRYAFSKVGFSKNKKQALLHVNYFSNTDPKYAFGYYFLLTKRGSGWVMAQRVKSWES